MAYHMYGIRYLYMLPRAPVMLTVKADTTNNETLEVTFDNVAYVWPPHPSH